MVKILVALCIVAAVQVCSAYEVAVPISKQPYGTGETRIVGGELATRGQFPHQVGINMPSQFCGGTLISKRWVMTTAHCVDGYEKWSVILGTNNLTDVYEPGRVTVASNKGIWHEDFNYQNLSSDIGLIGLPQDVQLTETVNIVRLPPKSYQNLDFTGQKVRTSGWGRTSDSDRDITPTLRFVDQNIISLEECNAAFGNFVTKKQYCTSGANTTGACNGDSGSAMTIGSGKTLINLGIVSFGSTKGCSKGYPTGFTATPFFVEWISEKTGIPVNDF